MSSQISDEGIRNAKFALGMNAIRELPKIRKAKQVVSPKELDGMVLVLQEFLASAKRTCPPTKILLREAVISLMQSGTVLSTAWDKTQLALVALKWAVTSLRLRPLGAQPDLFVEVKIDSENRKVIAHKCCLRDELSSEYVAFSIASPSPVKARAPDASEAEGSPEKAGEKEDSAFDLSTEFDADFLREIDELASQADLAAIPINFYTPRVEDKRHEDSPASGRSRADWPDFLMCHSLFRVICVFKTAPSSAFPLNHAYRRKWQ